MEENKLYIQKLIGNDVYYLSPRKRRWINSKSRKHLFGKFNEEAALEYLKHANIIDPKHNISLSPID